MRASAESPARVRRVCRREPIQSFVCPSLCRAGNAWQFYAPKAHRLSGQFPCGRSKADMCRYLLESRGRWGYRQSDLRPTACSSSAGRIASLWLLHLRDVIAVALLAEVVVEFLRPIAIRLKPRADNGFHKFLRQPALLTQTAARESPVARWGKLLGH